MVFCLIKLQLNFCYPARSDCFLPLTYSYALINPWGSFLRWPLSCLTHLALIIGQASMDIRRGMDDKAEATFFLPKSGVEPLIDSYKETVLTIKTTPTITKISNIILPSLFTPACPA